MTGASYEVSINEIIVENPDPSLADTSFDYFYCMVVADAYSNVLALNSITINFIVTADFQPLLDKTRGKLS